MRRKNIQNKDKEEDQNQTDEPKDASLLPLMEEEGQQQEDTTQNDIAMDSDVDDGHDGHNDRPGWKVLNSTAKVLFSATCLYNSYCLEYMDMSEDTEEEREAESRR